MSGSTCFFVCGTPSNKGGFEVETSVGSQLPGEPAAYLEVFRPAQMSTGPTFVARKITVDGVQYGFVALYHPINPNDSRTNRGAYIASGSLFPLPANLDQTLGALLCVMQNSGKLEAMRDSNNAFFPGFKVEAFPFTPYYPDLPARFLIDALCGVEKYVGEVAERGFFFTVGTTAPTARDGSFYFIENERAGLIERQQQEIALLKQRLQQTAVELAAAQAAYENLANRTQRKVREQTLATGYQGYNPEQRGTGLTLVEPDGHREPGSRPRLEQPGSRQHKTVKRKHGAHQDTTIGDYWRELKRSVSRDWLVTGIVVSLVLVVGIVFAYFLAKDAEYLRERNEAFAETPDRREAAHEAAQVSRDTAEGRREQADNTVEDSWQDPESADTSTDRADSKSEPAGAPTDQMARDDQENPVAAKRRQLLDGD